MIPREDEWMSKTMRVAVISDIHGNLAALEAVLEKIKGQVEQVWCLGDIVGYGPNPNKCVERVRQEKVICVVGNHDWACLGKLDLGDFNPDARWACQWTMGKLNEESRRFLNELPSTLVMDEFTLVHGSPRASIWEYITHSSIALENFGFFDTRVCLVGHTHVPLAFHLAAEDAIFCERHWLTDAGPMDLSSGRWILNPGGVGQPRDGDPRAPFVIVDTETLRVEIHRADYPVQETQEQMKAAGHPYNLITRLAFGW
jgi:predicted phosphodiesterase